MNKKALFMPYDPQGPIMSAQKEYGVWAHFGAGNANQLTIDHELAKGNTDARQVWFDGKRNAFLAGMQDGQVYIRGHGMPGENRIEGGRGGEKVRFDVVVDRLIKSGLPKSFVGKIKCYNCHSAETIGVEGSVNSRVTETNGMPFAQLIADEMFARGYKKCTFYGYVGSLDSMPKAGSQGTHKYVRHKVIVNGKAVQAEMGRVSESRFQFFPNPAPKKPGFMKKLLG